MQEVLKKKETYDFLIKTIIFMNILDLTLTYIGLKAQYLQEGNVALAYLYNQNHIYFIAVKVIAILYFSFSLLVLMKTLTKKIKILLWITFFVYNYITILHLIILISLKI